MTLMHSHVFDELPLRSLASRHSLFQSPFRNLHSIRHVVGLRVRKLLTTLLVRFSHPGSRNRPYPEAVTSQLGGPGNVCTWSMERTLRLGLWSD